MSKTQTNPANFQRNPMKNELPTGFSKEKEPLKLTGKHFNGNLNFNKPEFANNIMKSPKNNPLNFMALKEESKKTEAFNNNIESIAQNLAKNKIIPSFLVQKKAGDNIATTPSSNSHLKMNNFLPANNKNSMLKTNAAPGNSNNLFKTNNFFNVSKK